MIDKRMQDTQQYDRVIIRMDEWGNGTVEINGMRLHSTTGVSFETVAGVLPVVTIKCVASVDANMPALVNIRESKDAG